MKLFFLFLLFILSWQVQSSMKFQCGLGIEVFPLEYTLITRSVSTRIRFSSNCMKLRDFVLEGFFTFQRRISKTTHPTTLKFTFLRNKYSIDFSGPQIKDENTIVRKLQYQIGRLSPSKINSGKALLTKRNNLILDEQIMGSFSKKNLRKMLYMKNPIRCKISKDLDVLECKIK